MNSNSYYQLGGALIYDHPTYVPRKADKDLCEFVRNPETRLCFVLAPRQMGKTSLMVKTANELKKEGFICVSVSIQGFAETSSPQRFYYTILYMICDNLVKEVRGFNPDFAETLDSYFGGSSLALGKIFENFVVNEILEKIDRKLVIYLDEIQTINELNLQNSFWGFMKSLSENPKNCLNKLKIIFLGVAKSSDLINSPNYSFNVGEFIEINGLEGSCKQLQYGLKNVDVNPEELLTHILNWTGGQPFLTQLICSLVVNQHNKINQFNFEKLIENLIENNLIDGWRNKDNQHHLSNIEHFFITVKSGKKIREKLDSIEVYKKVLEGQEMYFALTNKLHMDLIISGLVTKKNASLKVTNPIYKKVFTNDWIKETKEYLQRRKESSRSKAPLNTIYNRDVFILIDRSGSMKKKDAADSVLERWDSLQELIMGHVEAILAIESNLNNRVRNRICDSISISLFNEDKVGPSRQVKKSEHVEEIFLEYEPAGPTFVVPTLRDCLNRWFDSRSTSGTQGAFFIIYTDGQFDDREKFEHLITENYSKLDDEGIIKIIVIGIGKDLDKEYFQQLDDNIKSNVDKEGKLCDIVDFELETEMDDILEIMKRGLITKTKESLELTLYSPNR